MHQVGDQPQFSVVAWYLLSIILHLEHTDAYSPYPLHIAMEEFPDFWFKQRAVFEVLTTEKFHPIEIHRRMQAVYGDQCVDVRTGRQWVRRFKHGLLRQADLSDKTRSWKACECNFEVRHHRRVSQNHKINPYLANV